MSLERALVWAVGFAACLVSVLVYLVSPTPPARLTLAALGVFVALPFAYVFAGWLLSYRPARRGWRDAP